MTIVHKGWLFYAEREVDAKVLLRYDRMKHRLRGRPCWRGLNKRWRKF